MVINVYILWINLFWSSSLGVTNKFLTSEISDNYNARLQCAVYKALHERGGNPALWFSIGTNAPVLIYKYKKCSLTHTAVFLSIQHILGKLYAI